MSDEGVSFLKSLAKSTACILSILLTPTRLLPAEINLCCFKPLTLGNNHPPDHYATMRKLSLALRDKIKLISHSWSLSVTDGKYTEAG